MNAKNDKDKEFEFFIKRSNVINSILGQDAMDQGQVLNDRLNPITSGDKVSRVLSNADIGFVFPDLVEYHRAMQDRLVKDEEMYREIWSEFIDSQMNIVLGVMGGWAIKSALGVLPRMSGGPAVASLMDKAGKRAGNMISGHMDFTTVLLIGYIGRLYVDKRDFDAELSRVDALRTSEGVAMMKLKSHDTENAGDRSIVVGSSPFALITDDDYLKQKYYFEEASRNASDEIKANLYWLVLPVMAGFGIKAFSAGLSRLRMAKERDWGAIGYFKQKKFLNRMKGLVYLRKNMRTNDLAFFGNPMIELGQLQAARDVMMSKAVSPRQRFLINERYELIIKTFGKDIESLAGMPHLQQAYATALYGPSGSVRTLENIYSEYMRITHGGLL